VLRGNLTAPGVAAAGPGKHHGRGRQQLVHTATHGTLPMAVLEDAVFRLLTPATGAPSPPPVHKPQADAALNVPVAHAQYHPNPPPAPSGTASAPGVPNGRSPTGVAEMALLPSWVDANNPPAWYNDGGDIDELLEDADYLNWLEDTGDLEETYPPALAEPATVSSGGRAPAGRPEATLSMPEPAPVTAAPDPLVHPSVDSLSFLVDAPEPPPVPQEPVMDAGQPRYPSYAPSPPAASCSPHTIVEAPTNIASTGSVVTAMAPSPPLAGVRDSEAYLLGFPDMDMGDEQAFVSALLDNTGQGKIIFPKLASDVHLSQTYLSGEGVSGEDHETQEKLM